MIGISYQELTFKYYRVLGNEGYNSFELLHKLECVPETKTYCKRLLYTTHFDIQRPYSTQKYFDIFFHLV